MNRFWCWILGNHKWCIGLLEDVYFCSRCGEIKAIKNE
ncbi:MAG: uncharacterized protein YrrD [Candidatus Nitrosomirales archaeon]|jgi:uncharacterized protein YrrD